MFWCKSYTCCFTYVIFVAHHVFQCHRNSPSSVVSASQEDARADKDGINSSIYISDPVSEALDYVETIEQQRHNCSFGPTLNLQYNKERWHAESQISVQAANLLSLLSSRIDHHLMGHDKTQPDDVNLLYSLVRSNVDNYVKIFGSAIAFDVNLYSEYQIFCPYAFVTPDGVVTVKDLSTGYNYHTNVTDWFWVPYQRWGTHHKEDAPLRGNLSERVPHDFLHLTSEDGYWTQPYFDCGGGDVWMVTFSMPFFVMKSKGDSLNNQSLTFDERNDSSSEQVDSIFG